MLKNTLNIIILSFFNFVVLSLSNSIDVEQLYFDFEAIGISSSIELETVYIFIGVTLMTLFNFLFKPFESIYSTI